jgi:hypothetical protein
MMRSRNRLFDIPVIALALILFTGLVALQVASAQDDSSIIYRPVQIKRKPKPKRIYRPRPRRRIRPVVEQIAPLALQWRVLKVNEYGKQIETNPGATFHSGDRLRVGVKANQDGYLYIIHQPGSYQPGRILFPDSRLNDGQNFVRKNQEVVIPSNCPNPNDPCWYPVLPPAGQEYFTLVFSRDMLLDLPNKAAETGGLIPVDVIRDLKNSTGQIIKRHQGTTDGRFAIWVIKTNTADNEEIIEMLVLNKGE